MYTREIKLYVEIACFYPDSSSSNQRGYYHRRRRRPSFDAHYLLCVHFPVLFCISMPVFTLAYAKPWISFKRTLPTSTHYYHSFYRQYRQDIYYSNENEIARNIHLCQESSCPTKHIYFIIFRHNVLGNMQSGYNGTHRIPHFYPSNNLLYYSNLQTHRMHCILVLFDVTPKFHLSWCCRYRCWCRCRCRYCCKHANDKQHTNSL